MMDFDRLWKKTPTQDMQVTFSGNDLNLKTFSKYINDVETGLRKEVQEALRDVAKKFLESLKQSVYFQSLDLVPLSPRYAKQKESKGLDPRILINTGEYIETIEIVENQVSKGVLEIVIQAPDHDHSETKINLRLLSRLLEYGSKNEKMPARPHWRPVMKEFIALRGELAKDVTDVVALKIRNSLERKYGKTLST